MKLKDLPRVDRPREKLEKYGPERLSDSELLAILLGTGVKGLNVVELSNRLLKKFGAAGLAKASVAELKETFGLGSAKACEIAASFELSKRLLKGKKAVLILSPKEVWGELKDIRGNKKEHFIVFFLDTRNQEIKREVVSVGILNENLVHPREVFEPAIQCSAAQIIVAHNHPSGDTDPSEEDIAVTSKLKEAGRILGIEILDHIIVSQSGYLSFKEKKLI